ncbi:MAG: hypothetical protein R3244_07385, partial [Thermoanaerobaculia bacterium]|nr:hypothetical protein [Thermoanaerobaculia bacterium]
MMGVFTFIIMIVALVTLGEVASKWLEGSRARPSVEPAPDGEMARLREQVESLTDRVEQLSEELLDRKQQSAYGQAIAEKNYINAKLKESLKELSDLKFALD